MPDEPTPKELLEAISGLARDYKEAKLKSAGMPSWVPVAVMLIIQLVGVVWWFGQQDARINSSEAMHAANIRRLDAVDAASKEARLEQSKIVEINRQAVTDLSSKTSRRFRIIERKLNLPEGE